MAIQFQCPQGHPLSVGEHFAGKRFRCPKCQAISRVPDAATSPVSQASAGAAIAAMVDSPGLPTSQASPSASAEQTALADTPACEMPIEVASAAPLGLQPQADTADGNLLAKNVEPPAPGLRKSPPPLPKRPAIELPAPPLDEPLLFFTAAAAPPVVEPPPATVVDAFAGALSELLASPGLQDQPLTFRPKGESASNAPNSAAKKNMPLGADPNSARYQPDSYRAQNVYFLGMALGLLCVFHALPAFRHYELGAAPDWARAVAILSLIELAYVLWMVTAPDWLTVRVAMLLFAVVAALYGMILAMVIVTPRGHALWLDLDDVREPALWWCGAVLLLTCLMTYLCGRISFRWRKAEGNGDRGQDSAFGGQGKKRG